MSNEVRHLLQGALAFMVALGLGLLTAWMIIELQTPDPPAGPLEHVVPAGR